MTHLTPEVPQPRHDARSTFESLHQCVADDVETNRKIGRRERHLSQLKRLRQWRHEYGALSEGYSVIKVHTVDEDMRATIMELRPAQWKTFRCCHQALGTLSTMHCDARTSDELFGDSFSVASRRAVCRARGQRPHEGLLPCLVWCHPHCHQQRYLEPALGISTRFFSRLHWRYAHQAYFLFFCWSPESRRFVHAAETR